MQTKAYEGKLEGMQRKARRHAKEDIKEGHKACKGRHIKEG